MRCRGGTLNKKKNEPTRVGCSCTSHLLANDAFHLRWDSEFGAMNDVTFELIMFPFLSRKSEMDSFVVFSLCHC